MEAELQPMEADAQQQVLSDPDLLFQILSNLSEIEHLRPVLRASHALRSAALRPDLHLWRECNSDSFAALEPQDASAPKTLGKLIQLILGTSSRWSIESVLKLLSAKRHVVALDLSMARVPSQEACSAVLAALPTSLRVLAVGSDCSQPDAMLNAIRKCPRLGTLPNLQALDLRGVLTDRTLSGMRLLMRKERRTDAEGGGAGSQGVARLARVLPELRALAVGFHTYTQLGQAEGTSYLRAQCAMAPRLGAVSCMLSLGVTDLGPLDVHCAVCRRRIFSNLTDYLVHPAQQPHITYELHTDSPPIGSAVSGLDDDETRLACVGRCQPSLWIVDGGSGHVHHVLNRKYGVACGGPRNGRTALALAIRARAEGDPLPDGEELVDVFAKAMGIRTSEPAEDSGGPGSDGGDWHSEDSDGADAPQLQGLVPSL